MKKRMIQVFTAILVFGLVGSINVILGGATGSMIMRSRSMGHGITPQNGIIDKGDILYYNGINSKDDVVTYAAGKSVGYKRFGDYGDVIVYYPMGNKEKTPIVHRAICWVELDENGKYSVDGYKIYNASNITIEELHLFNYKPSNSGFITKGDNNSLPDQYSNGGICPQPVKIEWIAGKVTGLDDKNNGTSGGNESKGTPGFEFIALLVAMAAVVLARKRKLALKP